MKKDIKLVFEDSKILEVYRGTTVRDVLRELDNKQVIALRINGNAVDSDYVILEEAHVRMGQALPLVSEGETTYNVKFPIRNEDGSLLLKEMYMNSDLKETLNIWDMQLVSFGSKIIERRIIAVRERVIRPITTRKGPAIEPIFATGTSAVLML